jgi:alkanesulfonate monooxygenase
VRPVHPAGIPLFFGGSSAAAYQVGGKHADTFALWGEPLKETAEQIASVRAAAAAAGRPAPGISVSFRPILGATEHPGGHREPGIAGGAAPGLARRERAAGEHRLAAAAGRRRPGRPA